MKAITVLIILLTSLNLFAARTSIQGALGMVNGAFQLGGDFDYQKKRSHSLGGYFLFGAEKEGVRESFWAVGGDVKVFFGPDDWRVYIGPGLGVASLESRVAVDESEITFGSILKIGALINIAPKMHLGLEWSGYTNWFSEDAIPGFQVTNLVFRYDL